MNFSKIYGHEKTIKALKQAIENDLLFHCYLFTGEESIGKKLVALYFAKTLLCKKGGTQPCNSCNSCLKFDNMNHPDLEFIKPEKSLIKKEMIDNIIKTINVAPLESERKIIIIDDCDKMGMEAQNALLKTLEEPPSYINMILITSNNKSLIPTILSRSQIIKFHPLKSEIIKKLIVLNYGKSEEEASFIAHFTRGSIGKSINLCEKEGFFERRDKTINIIHNIVNGDKLNIINSVDYFLENKEHIDEIMDIILYWFRDLMIYKQVGNSQLILNRDKIQLLSKESSLDIDKINDIIDNVMETKKSIDNNVNYQLAIEAMLLNMQEVFIW